MKYIKTYENIGLIRDYSTGNYVLLYPNYHFLTTAIIIETKNLSEYRIITRYKNSDAEWIGWVNSSEIEKKISKKEYDRIRKEELEKIELEKSANKYNL